MTHNERNTDGHLSDHGIPLSRSLSVPKQRKAMMTAQMKLSRQSVQAVRMLDAAVRPMVEAPVPQRKTRVGLRPMAKKKIRRRKTRRSRHDAFPQRIAERPQIHDTRPVRRGRSWPARNPRRKSPRTRIARRISSMIRTKTTRQLMRDGKQTRMQRKRSVSAIRQ